MHFTNQHMSAHWKLRSRHHSCYFNIKMRILHKSNTSDCHKEVIVIEIWTPTCQNNNFAKWNRRIAILKVTISWKRCIIAHDEKEFLIFLGEVINFRCISVHYISFLRLLWRNCNKTSIIIKDSWNMRQFKSRLRIKGYAVKIHHDMDYPLI